jgi:hypothetical protein
MLAGRLCPELGGREEYLDLLGFNYYYDNQWQLEPHTTLRWANEDHDPRLQPLSFLLKRAWKRYNRPVVLTETSHPGVDRPKWMDMIGRECAAAIRAGVPLFGACLYPIIDRPDWDHLDNWHRAGLWDAELHPNELPTRVLYEPYAVALRQAQNEVQRAQRPKVKVKELSLT